ncbi:hypothetical protein H072_1087 [Dactylellina haptotyla CBS 200.50]|uniref:Lytic polysaccharide monooxygenase n=1 Tax=Dactylellina haptotyla (strain CBS 200.50) TaxID=1284197 RepID=S8APQ0_DACHA|nr:hypothetical protein H072_1087 [Dactylellina haptotyla CBS 200.50]
MQLILLSTAVLATIQSVSAHASIRKPKPIAFDELRGTYNAPLDRTFSNFPCKGYHLETLPNGNANPFVAAETWKAGQEASFVIDTIATAELNPAIAAHGGGSCQASISFDGGATFRVLRSFIGDCPRNTAGNSVTGDQGFTFTVPEDAPAGNAIFSWTWFAAIANREMYMDCAFVKIENANPNPDSFNKRPFMFVGFQTLGDCQVDEGTNLDFPMPGPDALYRDDKPGVEHQGKTKPTGAGCGHESSGGGEKILSQLPARKDMGGSGGGSGGDAPGAKPGLNPTPSSEPEPAPTESTSTVIMTATTVIQSTLTMVTSVTTGPNVVYVTKTMTKAIVDIVTVTATDYVSAPTGGPAKRSNLVSRDESCDFKPTLKVGGKCPVPSTKSSTWKTCVWKEFCGCLDQNLSPTDIVNFSQIKGHCDCVTMDVGCPAASKNRHRRRHARRGYGVDVILP